MSYVGPNRGYIGESDLQISNTDKTMSSVVLNAGHQGTEDLRVTGN
jgi:hypothetical protein